MPEGMRCFTIKEMHVRRDFHRMFKLQHHLVLQTGTHTYKQTHSQSLVSGCHRQICDRIYAKYHANAQF